MQNIGQISSASKLTGTQFLEGVNLERGGDFFQRGGGCSFYVKNKLKSEIFNNKKSLQAQVFFSVIPKNLKWEILTKNFVTFLKDQMGLRMKNFNIMGVHWKNNV